MEENIKKNQSELPIISLVFGSISFLFCLIIIFLHSFIHLLIAIDFLFIFSVLGLILGIISKTKKYEPKVISTLSIIFSSIASVVSVIIVIIFIGITVINSSDIIARTTELVTNRMSESDVSYKHYVEYEEDDEDMQLTDYIMKCSNNERDEDMLFIKKFQEITIKKLTRNNPTMKEKFDELKK